jgi:hypothetical protein
VDLFQDHPPLQVVSNQDQGGPILRPGAPPNKGLTDFAGASDFDSASLRLIDQILSAKPEKADSEDLAHFTGRLWGLFKLHAIDPTGRRTQNPHPPPKDLVAKFLAIAPPKTLGWMLQEFEREHSKELQIYSYYWFIRVAMQRCLGLSVEVQKKIETQLREVKKGKPKTPEQLAFAETREIAQQLRTLAKTKSIR